MSEKKITAGQASIEAMAKAPESRDPIELQREMLKEYCDNVIKCAQDGIKYYKKTFYIVVITKKERLMQNIIRSYYFHRQTCPTPDWDQAVYSFEPISHTFTELWVIPAQDIADMLYYNALSVIDEEKQLLQYVLRFYNGDLLLEAKRLNGEPLTGPVLTMSIPFDHTVKKAGVNE